MAFLLGQHAEYYYYYHLAMGKSCFHVFSYDCIHIQHPSLVYTCSYMLNLRYMNVKLLQNE